MNTNTMKKHVIFLIIAIFCLIIVIPVSAQVSNGGDDTVVSQTSTDTAGSATGAVSNGGDDAVSTPTIGGNAPSGSGIGAVSNGNDDDMTANRSTGGNNTPSTPSGSSGSSGSSGGGSYSFNNTQPQQISVSCGLINSFMRSGQANDNSEVTKLQLFLKNNQGLNVDVNGIFDEKTENAVKAFQAKYLSDTMGPWDATRPSGYVYITTVKKINQITCNQPLVLNADELNIINAYKNRDDSEQISSDTEVDSNSDNSTSTVETIEIGTDEDNNEVAGVAKASILKRFWNFVVSLFK